MTADKVLWCSARKSSGYGAKKPLKYGDANLSL